MSIGRVFADRIRTTWRKAMMLETRSATMERIKETMLIKLPHHLSRNVGGVILATSLRIDSVSMSGDLRVPIVARSHRRQASAQTRQCSLHVAASEAAVTGRHAGLGEAVTAFLVTDGTVTLSAATSPLLRNATSGWRRWRRAATSSVQRFPDGRCRLAARLTVSRSGSSSISVSWRRRSWSVPAIASGRPRRAWRVMTLR
jgi:hypothetical protein